MTLHLERDHPVALYQQLAQILREMIESRVLPPGSQVSSEEALMRRFGISRVTVRQALADLVEGGLLVRKQGKGTFVRAPVVADRLEHLHSVREVLQSQGLEPTIDVLRSEIISAPPAVLKVLHLEEGEQVLYMHRIYRVHEEPILVSQTYLPAGMAPYISAAEVRAQTIFTVMEETLHVVVNYAMEKIRAEAAAREYADLLEVKPGFPLLVLDRVTFSDQDAPLEYVTFHYRGDRCEFSLCSRRQLIEA